jgi:DTW domain-containing protein YfiP
MLKCSSSNSLKKDEQSQLMRVRIQRKLGTLSNGKRCPTCWLRKLDCICHVVKPLKFSLNVEFCTYLHETEWLNAADDAKLLCLAAPDKTTMLVHGRDGDDKHLQLLVKRAKRSCLLFPDDDAITIEQFLKLKTEANTNTNTKTNTNTNTKTTTHFTTSSSLSSPSSSLLTTQPSCDRPDLLIIVVDATWRRARKMAKHLEENVIGEVKHIKLETDTVSVYSRTQTQTGRICTIEAVSLLLQELGEDDQVCKSLINAVLINNQALRPKKTNNILYETGRGKFHPAWYFPTELYYGKEDECSSNSSSSSSSSSSSNNNNIGRPLKRAKR